MMTSNTTSDSAEAGPPRAERRIHTTTVHGHTLEDPYFWLRERENPEVRAYLEAENAYTRAQTADIADLADHIYEEMKARIQETDLSVPSRKGSYFYYTRTEAGKAYSIHCRRRHFTDGHGDEEVLLDGNTLAEGKAYFDLGAFAISPDHRYLAYSVDHEGDERYTLRIRDLMTGEHCVDEIPDTSTSVEWAADNRTLFYSTLDESMRPYKLFRHELGTDPAGDVCVFHEQDEAFYLSLVKTRSDRFLLLDLSSTATTEIWMLEADHAGGTFECLAPRRPNIEYDVEHHGDKLFIVTNDDAVNFRLMETPVDLPARVNWRERIPHRPDVFLTGVDAFRNHLVMHAREDGLTTLSIEHLESGETHRVEFDEDVYTVSTGINPEFETDTLRLRYTSLVTPVTVYDYDMNTRKLEQRKRQEVRGGYDPGLYASRRVHATSHDGARVPISLVYRKDLAVDAPQPTLLYGYGAYGISIDPTFGSGRLSLLDRGFVFAIAHIRGGAEMGRTWYDRGKLADKINTFHDFIACADYLCDSGTTSRDRLGILGGSAGGLLVGATLNMRPDLCRAAVAAVPFVDVINTMLDPTLPLTVIEYEQWGDPNEAEAFERILGYSPYDNIHAVTYPDLLVTAGWNDPRVQYWEPAKWVAKMRSIVPGGCILLKTNMDAGHAGASGRYEAIRETAFEYAFLIDRLTGAPKP